MRKRRFRPASRPTSTAPRPIWTGSFAVNHDLDRPDDPLNSFLDFTDAIESRLAEGIRWLADQTYPDPRGTGRRPHSTRQEESDYLDDWARRR